MCLHACAPNKFVSPGVFGYRKYVIRLVIFGGPVGSRYCSHFFLITVVWVAPHSSAICLPAAFPNDEAWKVSPAALFSSWTSLSRVCIHMCFSTPRALGKGCKYAHACSICKRNLRRVYKETGGEHSLQTGSREPKKPIQPSSDRSVNKTGKVSRRDRERQDGVKGWGRGYEGVE